MPHLVLHTNYVSVSFNAIFVGTYSKGMTWRIRLQVVLNPLDRNQFKGTGSQINYTVNTDHFAFLAMELPQLLSQGTTRDKNNLYVEGFQRKARQK